MSRHRDGRAGGGRDAALLNDGRELREFLAVKALDTGAAARVIP